VLFVLHNLHNAETAGTIRLDCFVMAEGRNNYARFACSLDNHGALLNLHYPAINDYLYFQSVIP
jgi:hypothetical protein